jgi:hypothetical protein
MNCVCIRWIVSVDNLTSGRVNLYEFRLLRMPIAARNLSIASSLCYIFVIFLVYLLISGDLGASEFNSCPKLPTRQPPTSVHNLRIDDIAVISALGDSIMAGFGAKGHSSTPPTMNSTFENRGVSFSMGGDEGAVTLANLISLYNPKVIGASVGDHIAEICYAQWCLPFNYWPKYDQLNAAQSGATGIKV